MESLGTLPKRMMEAMEDREVWRLKVRLDWTRSDAKQPKFDVIDSSRMVATGRNLREQLCNSACLQAVVR